MFTGLRAQIRTLVRIAHCTPPFCNSWTHYDTSFNAKVIAVFCELRFLWPIEFAERLSPRIFFPMFRFVFL